MTEQEFSVFVSFCFLMVLFSIIIKIQDMTTPKFVVVKACPEDGFEIRRNAHRIWHEILDENKYNNYINRRHKELLDQLPQDHDL